LLALTLTVTNSNSS